MSGDERAETMPAGRPEYMSDAEHRAWQITWYLLPFADEALKGEGLSADMRQDLEDKRDRWRAELVLLQEEQEAEAADFFANLEASFRYGVHDDVG